MKIIKDQAILQTYLEKHKILDNFTSDLSRYFQLFYYKVSEKITELDNYLDYFYFLVDGKLRIIMEEENGKQILLRFYTPLNIIGDLEFIENYQVKTTVEVIFPSYLIAIDLKILSGLMIKNAR